MQNSALELMQNSQITIESGRFNKVSIIILDSSREHDLAQGYFQLLFLTPLYGEFSSAPVAATPVRATARSALCCSRQACSACVSASAQRVGHARDCGALSAVLCTSRARQARVHLRHRVVRG